MLSSQEQQNATLGLSPPQRHFDRGLHLAAKPTKLPPVVGPGRNRKLPPVQGLKPLPGPIGFQPLGSLAPLGQPSSTLMPSAAPNNPAEQSEHFIKHQDTEELKDFLKHY